MDRYRATDCCNMSCKLLIQHMPYLQFKSKTSRNQKMNQVTTEVLSLLPSAAHSLKEEVSPSALKHFSQHAKFPLCNFFKSHLIQRPGDPITVLNMLGAVEKRLFSSNKVYCQQLHPFVSLHPLLETYFFDVDKLADIHVIIPLLDIRSYRLNYLADHGDNNVPPGQWQGLIVEKLLKQCHHVVVISRPIKKAKYSAVISWSKFLNIYNAEVLWRNSCLECSTVSFGLVLYT